MGKLLPGIQCKACNKPLGKGSIDLELCNECMEVVMDYNKDLIDSMPATDFEELL